MKIKQALDYMFAPLGVYNIAFGEDDETQFFADGAAELEELWEEFCKENGFDADSVACVSLYRDDRSIFTDYMWETDATVTTTAEGWVVVTAGGWGKTFASWVDMINFMEVEMEEAGI